MLFSEKNVSVVQNHRLGIHSDKIWADSTTQNTSQLILPNWSKYLGYWNSSHWVSVVHELQLQICHCQNYFSMSSGNFQCTSATDKLHFLLYKIQLFNMFLLQISRSPLDFFPKIKWPPFPERYGSRSFLLWFSGSCWNQNLHWKLGQ